MIACIVLFGGRGHRFEHFEPKQYYEIGGKSLLVHCLESIKIIDNLSQLVIVCEPTERSRVQDIMTNMKSFGKKPQVVFCDSGKQRSDSVLNGLRSCLPSTEWILVHDGARAFCPPDLFRSLCEHLLKFQVGVVPGLPPVDTIVQRETQDKTFISNSLSRHNLSRVQTPQGFSYPQILQAYIQGKKNNFEGTDCSSYALFSGHPVKIIPGSEENIKVTSPIDLELAKYILRKRDLNKC